MEPAGPDVPLSGVRRGAPADRSSDVRARGQIEELVDLLCGERPIRPQSRLLEAILEGPLCPWVEVMVPCVQGALLERSFGDAAHGPGALLACGQYVRPCRPLNRPGAKCCSPWRPTSPGLIDLDREQEVEPPRFHSRAAVARRIPSRIPALCDEIRVRGLLQRGARPGSFAQPSGPDHFLGAPQASVGRAGGDGGRHMTS